MLMGIPYFKVTLCSRRGAGSPSNPRPRWKRALSFLLPKRYQAYIDTVSVDLSSR